ncbi:hypothetical protein PHLCEN_2v6240 [Hermanssonia centrifuga]|uniref:Uncharacterized protein n=1 Tax=Hermanssonia centrifuga TaxID=98765 RepID=A0A2R6P007_9APHY|nr:hypothetical protein PHLCEN_2v6240 [Hermanssonia centrifuga]
MSTEEPSAKKPKRSYKEYQDEDPSRVECRIRGRAQTELGMALDHLRLMKKRNEWVIGAFNEHESKRVAVESDALKSSCDCTQRGATGN